MGSSSLFPGPLSPDHLSPPPLTSFQRAMVKRPFDAKIFLEGPTGAGKTITGVERLLHLMASGLRADSILLLVPQRTLAAPYYEALRHPGVVAGGLVSVLTVGGLAQRMVELFWPLVAREAGFAHPHRPPIFLTLETAQYFMARLVRPLLDKGYFDTVTINRNRLYSQILDDLNKAAVVGFPHTEISERLKSAWVGEPAQMRVYEDTQECASRFRGYCLAHNLLDFSLQVEVFRQGLWPNPVVREYLMETYRHLIVDNLEEDTPIAYDLLAEWLPDFDSAFLIYDWDAGYRRFLGADPVTAYHLKALCAEQAVFDQTFVAPPELETFARHLAIALNRDNNVMRFRWNVSPEERQPDTSRRQETSWQDVSTRISFEYHRFHPQMLDWVAEQIAGLVHDEQIPPAEVVVLAPFLSDALRFSLTHQLEIRGVPAHSHRPSRALRDEPAAQCLLTLAALAHPNWGILPARFDVAYALIQAIDGLDLVRAQLLAEIVYRFKDGVPTLSSFDRIKLDVQERITYVLGNRYEVLRGWIEDYRARPVEELDHFWSRLFGEVLSQPGYGFHRDFDAGKVTANLVESARKFRWAAAGNPIEGSKPLGQEYIEMVQDGVVAAQYIRSWQVQPEEAVLMAPAYTFLMVNRPVDYQFWLDIGGRGWFERLYQPLTHPYVLNRHWPPGAPWTDAQEYETSQEALYRLVLGLIRRCRRKIYLGISDLGEQGFEQRGPLLKAIQRVLRDLQSPSTS